MQLPLFHRQQASPRILYTEAAHCAASTIIGVYSTSFTLATRLLPTKTRRDIASLYALVRIVDEIVDGTADSYGASSAETLRILEDYRSRVFAALELGYSPDPIIHAFTDVALRNNFDPSWVDAFFASMRTDAETLNMPATWDEAGLASYIYGSAEVIGLMCLAIFLHGRSAPAQATQGARALGAAFQKINFLRDYSDDVQTLHRIYFPTTADGLTEESKQAIIRDIRCDLDRARQALPLLPSSARRAVSAAWVLFNELTSRLESTPASELATHRVRVPTGRKLRLTVRSLVVRP